MSLLHRFLTRLFPLEEINGRELCPTYLYRWTLFKRWQRGIYLHKFVGDDWSRDLHDHPRRFISIGLRGSYIEQTPSGERLYRAPWVRSFPATHVHRLRLARFCVGCGAPEWKPEDHTRGCYIPLLLPCTCWTLVIVLKPSREWGFWNSGRWIHWRKYVWSKTAEERSACP